LIELNGAKTQSFVFASGAPGPILPFPFITMAGVGKLLKQAQKMQRQIEELQKALEVRELDISSGGGAVQVKITAAGKFLALKLDPEFLKEDPKLIEETVLNAVREAAQKAKELNDAEMQRISAGFQMPGMF
jgi:DNA-binding YbaB/EbfC family protein